MNICAPDTTVPEIAEVSVVPQRPKPLLVTDEAAFCDWMAHAVPGAAMIYYRGHLAFDRMPSAGVFADRERKRLVALAKRAMQAAEDGQIHLVQRRRGPHDYSYIAIKARGRLSGRVVPPGATAGR